MKTIVQLISEFCLWARRQRLKITRPYRRS